MKKTTHKNFTLDVITPSEAGNLFGLFRERVNRSSNEVAYSYIDLEKHLKGDTSWTNITWSDMEGLVGRWIALLENEGFAKGDRVASSEQGDRVASSEQGDRVASSEQGDRVASSEQGDRVASSEQGDRVASSEQGDRVASSEQGDRVALWSRNCIEWVSLDLASQALGLITVPLYFDDRAENVAYIIQDSDCHFLMLENHEQWTELKKVKGYPWNLKTIVSINCKKEEGILKSIQSALPELDNTKEYLNRKLTDPSVLATIVYTSGTTGNPKGVMLSHSNILKNAYNGLKLVPCYREDHFFSFLPLSHTFERTAGYYLSMMSGSSVTFSRSKHKIAEDIVASSPTVMLSVPRFFEKIYNGVNTKISGQSFLIRGLFKLTLYSGWKRFKYTQGISPWHPSILLWPLLDKIVASKIKAKLGGRLRVSISGGAPLSYSVAKMFLSLGINLIQGYGMTETSPVVSVNPIDDNDPKTVGKVLDDVEVSIGKNDELLVKGHGVMLGYWNNDEATSKTIDKDGWLHTGDKAEIKNGHLAIKGRIKEIIVLANGEKVPPGDIENAIESDPLIEQAMIAGEGKPFITAFIVITEESLKKISNKLKLGQSERDILINKTLEDYFVGKIDSLMKRFPGFASVKRCAIYTTPWTVEDGLITPTLKLKRKKVLIQVNEDFSRLYEGH